MKQTLQNLIANGKTKDAISELRRITQNDTDLLHQVNLLAARFATYEKQKLGNLETPSVLNVELNQINNGLLSVIAQLSEEERREATPSVSNSFLSKKNLLLIGGGLVALIGILANLTSVLDYFGIKPNETGALKNVTVQVDDKMNATTLRKQGYVIMFVEGGEPKKALIDDKDAAYFQNVKIGDKVRLKVDFSEPYRPLKPDSIYTIPADGRINLTVGLQNLGRVFGSVIYRDQPQRTKDLMQVLGLKADLHKAKFEWDSVLFCLELIVNLDTTDVDNIKALADFFNKQNKKHEATTYYEKALTLAKTPNLKATFLNNLGNTYCANQKMPQAEAAYTEALSLYRQLAEKNPMPFCPMSQ